ncbi:MAG: DUF3850 domain-containing protein [bacterium]|nr:DUF3850 domain-containing protein [bacterium]
MNTTEREGKRLRAIERAARAHVSNNTENQATTLHSLLHALQPLREAKTHELKTWGLYWDAAKDGTKRFEIRRDDRDIQEGDTVALFRTQDCGISLADEDPIRFRVGRAFRFTVAGCEQMFGLEPLDGTLYDDAPALVAFDLLGLNDDTPVRDAVVDPYAGGDPGTPDGYCGGCACHLCYTERERREAAGEPI